MAYTLTFPVEKKRLPSRRLRPDEKELSDLLSLCSVDEITHHTSTYYYIEIFVHDFCTMHEITGLEYINKLQTSLDPGAIQKAIDGFSRMLWCFKNKPEETSEFLDGSLYSKEVQKAVDLDDHQLGGIGDYDDENFYTVLSVIRCQLSILNNAMSTGRHVLHMLLETDEGWETRVNERVPCTPKYPKQLLTEVESILERGLDADAMPFHCPSPRSLTYGGAKTWYRSMLTQLPELTADSESETRRNLKGELRVAAIISLIEPHSAPRFFTEHPLTPDIVPEK